MGRPVVIAVVVLLLAACGGAGSPSPEKVVRAWSVALNSGDNEAAAKLFAPDARVIQGPTHLRLRTLADAIHFNAALPCSGRVVTVENAGDVTTATFELGNRPTGACDAYGARATAVFEVQHGKIVRWQQINATPAGPTY
jgi:limonene-1,2-epoxide hydrolase